MTFILHIQDFVNFINYQWNKKKTLDKILKQKHNYQDGRETKGERKTIWKGIRLIKWNNNDPLQDILILSNDK